MKCFIGLGNPGDQYNSTKHNFGYWIIDSYLKKNNLKLKLGKGDFVFSKTGDAIFAKTTTFMNNSGPAVKDIMQFFSIDIKDVIIVYDDIDLPLGTIRFRSGGSSGGHRGLDSIIYNLQREDFIKLRVGIATNENMRPSESYVLKPFPIKYNNQIIQVIDNAKDGMDYLINNSINETMNRFNRKIKGEE